MKPRLWTGMVVFLVMSAAGLWAQGDPPDATFLTLTGALLIDGTGADPVPDSVVVIQNERILYAGPQDRIEVPSNAEIIDASGLTILPGFINSHVHGALASRNREIWAQSGVTTVRDLGCPPSSLPVSRELYPPSPERARLVAAGPLITVPGGYPIVPFGGSWAATVTSQEEARELAEDLLDNGGADLLKLAIETGTGFGLSIPVLSPAEAGMLVRVAHGRGTVASAHITSVVDIGRALDAGADDLAHMAVDREVPETEIQRIIDQGVLWVPTLELWACNNQTAMAVANLRRFVQAGGQVAMGTDYEGYTCDWELGMPMTELELMRQAGMTPMQIIVASTLNGARACNLDRELGTLTKNKVADLFAVAGDPLEDLQALEEVMLVIHYGRVIRNELEPPVGTTARFGAQRP